VLGVAWDGTGYGTDGTIWGGEFLLADESGFQRFASLRTFRLPGGAKAVREPRRSALGLLHEILGDRVFARPDLPPVRACAPHELALLRQMLAKGIQSPRTSSVGRLFDAIASLAGLRHTINFEGQAAMELEFVIDDDAPGGRYPFRLVEHRGGTSAAAREFHGPAYVVDWEPMVRAAMEDAQRGAAAGVMSARFHRALAAVVVEVAARAGEERVVLSGGCFQNRFLTQCAVAQLREAGFRPYWHQRFPPNDGGIALGQAVVAAHRIKKG
jgi:hydrogenase maturation protein HypF